MVDVGVQIISNGLVLEINRKILDFLIDFIGLAKYTLLHMVKMLGERPNISSPSIICKKGYATYLLEQRWRKMCNVPIAQNGICPQGGRFEAENYVQLAESALGKAMKYTRFWLKKHGLIADGFFRDAL